MQANVRTSITLTRAIRSLSTAPALERLFAPKSSLNEDAYHSRLKVPSEYVLPRPDKVVWSSELKENGPSILSKEDLADFDKNGFIVKKIFSQEEIQTIYDNVNTLREECKDKFDDDRVIIEPDEFERSTESPIRSIFDVHLTNQFFNKVTSHKNLAEISSVILGSDVYIHQSRINFKPAFRGAGFYWHSDFETWHMEDGLPRPRCLSAALALSSNFPWNGPLLVIPGSHKFFVPCIGETPENHYRVSLRNQQIGVPPPEILKTLVDELGIYAITGEPGTAVFFDSNLMHGSSNNISPYPRSNLFVVYNSVENQLQAPYAGTTSRPEHIAHRNVIPTISIQNKI